MAVTANPLATAAAAAILRAGGSAADAAVAAQLMLGLVEPQSSGLGGGGFALYWDNAKQRLYAWDGRETAPAAMSEDHFLIDGQPMPPPRRCSGRLCCGSTRHSGPVKKTASPSRQTGLEKSCLQRRFLRAEQGFSISPRLHQLTDYVASRYTLHPQLASYLLDAKGKPLPVGHLLKNPDYATTLKIMRDKGSRPFYRGRLGKNIVAAVRSDPIRPGLLTMKDLRSYRIQKRKPLCGPFQNFSVCGMPPPSSGGAAVVAALGDSGFF